MADNHVCFTVGSTSYLRNLPKEDIRGECIAVNYQAAPVVHEDGSKSMSLNFPILVVTNWLSDQQDVAEKVARILNENWERT